MLHLQRNHQNRSCIHKILIKPDTIAYDLYKNQEIYERHRHRFEVNLDYLERLERNGLMFSGKSMDKKRMEILELQDHYFFFASQFHGEFRSRPSRMQISPNWRLGSNRGKRQYNVAWVTIYIRNWPQEKLGHFKRNRAKRRRSSSGIC